MSAADGQKLAEHEIAAAPVLDGMATANGRLYVSMSNGGILCLAGQ
jgi:hypothetical protein